MPSTEPATLIDWLEIKLAQKLASLPDDKARRTLLTLQGNVWRYRRQLFITTNGNSEVPHPVYGEITATDFVLVIGLLDLKRQLLEKAMAAASRPAVTVPAFIPVAPTVQMELH